MIGIFLTKILDNNEFSLIYHRKKSYTLQKYFCHVTQVIWFRLYYMGERGARNFTMFDGGYKFWYFLGYLGPNNHEKNIPGFMEPSPEIVASDLRVFKKVSLKCSGF